MMRLIAIVIFTLFASANQAAAQGGGSCASGTTWEFIFGGSGQNVYVHCGIVCDPQDPNDCDTIINGQGMNILTNGIWKVGGDTCNLVTHPIILPESDCSEQNNTTQVTIRRDKEGAQIGAGDAYMLYHIYCAGTLVYYDSIPGNWPALSGNSNVRTDTINVLCGYPDTMLVEITIGTVAGNKKLKILEGGTCVTCLGNIFLSLSIANEGLYLVDDQLNFAFEVLNDNEAIDHIALARSIDGKNFTPVGYIDPVPGKQPRTLYTLTDPDYSQPAYYRVEVSKQDGTTAYSKILFSGENADAGVNVYPNPIRKGQKLTVDHAWGYESVTISDIRGRVVHMQQLQAEGNGRASLNLPKNVGAGLYFMQFSNGFQSAHFKVIVQE